jgi:hypothetical protein
MGSGAQHLAPLNELRHVEAAITFLDTANITMRPSEAPSQLTLRYAGLYPDIR